MTPRRKDMAAQQIKFDLQRFLENMDERHTATMTEVKQKIELVGASVDAVAKVQTDQDDRLKRLELIRNRVLWLGGVLIVGLVGWVFTMLTQLISRASVVVAGK